MANITYDNTGGDVTVMLDRKTVGYIRKVEGGYAYFPKGSAFRGETFATIRKVKDSLEEE